jgi:hypothetical protein
MEVQGHHQQILHETPPTGKITRAKWTGGVAPGVECFFCKCEALSSSPRSTKKQKQHLLELVNRFRKVSEHKINIKNQL